jgi:hypothetical protein
MYLYRYKQRQYVFLVVFYAIIDKAPTSQGLSFRARRQREPFHCLVALSYWEAPC